MKHIVGFSGGIDSQACLRWVRERFSAEDIIAMNSNAGGNEDPLTEEFVALYSSSVFPVVCVQAIVADLDRPGAIAKLHAMGLKNEDPLTFDLLARAKGRFPGRMSQFCTSVLKLIPQVRWIKENFGANGRYAGEDFETYTGVRRDESQKRANAAEREWDGYFDCYLNRPIVGWTKQQCFDYVREAGEPINELYSLGFGRVGCAPCINSSKDDVLAWSQRRPEMIEKVRRWEKEVGRTYFPPIVPGLAINWIDDVVRWSQTSRGGVQTNLLRVLNDRPACESKYGLCE